MASIKIRADNDITILTRFYDSSFRGLLWIC